MIADGRTGQPEQINFESKADVVLISMPFVSVFRPSIGLELLKASLTSIDIPAKSLYFTLGFAEMIGASLNEQIANGYPYTPALVGEWIFASSLFDSARLDSDGYIDDVLRGRSPAYLTLHKEIESNPEASKELESFIQRILTIPAKVNSFLDECLEQVIGYRPKVVGFTSVFQQQLASLSLAKRVKAQSPETLIVFGGANCEGVMGAEIIRQFSYVDAVISGEGEVVFPQLVRRVLERGPISDLRGVYTIETVGRHFHGNYLNGISVTEMDDLPVPNYDDYFRQLEATVLDERHPVRLLFETSRGCWWGERNHCTFCGLNGAAMTYRSKSAGRALNELVSLTDKYPNCTVEVVDNILDMKYFKDFIPQLAARQLKLNLFYEVKANLKKEQVSLLREAGVNAIQPGIESLSSQVLGLMRKGVKALQNIQLLKWCKELGVEPYWNLLWGFPSESPEEYTRMAELVPLISHLKPPDYIGPIRLDRFSPNYDQASRFGLGDVAPYPAYSYIYPFPRQVVANFAYYFTFNYQDHRDVGAYTRPLAEEVDTWKRVHRESDLFSKDMGSFMLICDLRPIASERITVVTDPQRILYTQCDAASTITALQRTAERFYDREVAVTEVEQLLQPLIERGLLIRDGTTYLSLAIPLGRYSPAKSVLQRFPEPLIAINQ